MTPYEALHGRQPNISNLRALGCQAWYLIPSQRRETKLHPYMAEARLLAYQTDGIYRLYDIKTKKIVISRDVIFQEMPPTDLPKPSYDLDAVHKPSADQAMNRDEMERQRRRFAPAEFLPSGDDDHPNETDDIDQIEDHTDH
ncbi:hypothetical protein N7448_009015 [Penicillium atrosanguineum]|nr:hypothetical protein N7448_009015 [Penicillium atrosanguineum]